MPQKSSIRSLFENMNTKVFFLLLFLYQLIFIFQGIDFLDEGFTATFYQQFFTDPSSVEYNFMFWLSGLIGGTFAYVFPDSGLLGLRFLSILFHYIHDIDRLQPAEEPHQQNKPQNWFTACHAKRLS